MLNINTKPSDWQETTLGEVAEIKTGKNIPTLQQLNKGAYEIIGANGLIGYSDIFLLDGEYILTGRVGTIGEITYKKGRFYPSDNVIFIQSNKDNFNKFLFYLLKTKQLKLLNVGSTQPLIKQSDIKNLPISLPPLPEQRAIAAVLSSLDDKIELLRQENETLEQIGQTIFKEWFGKYSVDKPEELPEGWRVGKLGETFKIKYGKSDKNINDNGKYPVYGAGGVVGHSDNFNYDEYQVIIGCRGTCGNVTLSYEKSKITHNSLILLNDWSGPFNYLCLSNIDIKKSITGSTQPQITINDLSNIELLVPPERVVHDFSQLISSIFEKIKNNKINIKYTSFVRDSLLPKLMSGEVRVK